MIRPTKSPPSARRRLARAAAGCCQDVVYQAEHLRVRDRDRARLEEIERLAREHAEMVRRRGERR